MPCSCTLFTIKVFLPMLVALLYISCPSLLCSGDSIWEVRRHFTHHIQIFSSPIVHWDHDEGHHLPLVFLDHWLQFIPYVQYFCHAHASTVYLLLFQYLVQEKRLLSLCMCVVCVWNSCQVSRYIWGHMLNDLLESKWKNYN